MIPGVAPAESEITLGDDASKLIPWGKQQYLISLSL